MKLTQETILKTRQWFAEYGQICLDDAVNNREIVPNLPDYIKWKERHIKEYLAGKWDNTYEFQQRAIYIQTSCWYELLPDLVY